MRNLRETRYLVILRKLSATLAATTLAAVLLSGCAVVGGASKAVQDTGNSEQKETTASAPEHQNTRDNAGANTETNAEASAQETTQGGGSPSGDSKVVLSLRGESGAAFDLSCRVGSEREESSGEVPERLVFTPGEEESLECVIQKKDPGGLRATMFSDGNRTIRQTNTEDATITFVYRDGNISGETNSSASSGSIQSSQSSNVQSRSSGSSTQSSSSSQSVSITD